MVKCKGCGGTYEPIQTDGTQYFHACPPLNVAELRAALKAGTLVLSASDSVRFQAAQDADTENPPPPLTVSQADRFLATLSVPRPNARDENLASTAEKNKGAIKAPGAGVVALP